MHEPSAPSLERQRDHYAEVLRALEGKPVVIRTIDLGGDKVPDFTISIDGLPY